MAPKEIKIEFNDLGANWLRWERTPVTLESQLAKVIGANLQEGEFTSHRLI